MPEVMTPEQTQRYIEITEPKFMSAAFDAALQNSGPAVPVPAELNLIG
ncbi:MAG: hypothetical protein ACT4O9_08270 [Blastocatellia bacterium]